MATIQFTDVTRIFQRDGKDFLTLDQINLTVQDQEFVAIVGPSGCGKLPACAWLPVLNFPAQAPSK